MEGHPLSQGGNQTQSESREVCLHVYNKFYESEELLLSRRQHFTALPALEHFANTNLCHSEIKTPFAPLPSATCRDVAVDFCLSCCAEKQNKICWRKDFVCVCDLFLGSLLLAKSQEFPK